MKKLVKLLVLLSFSTSMSGQHLVLDTTFGTNGFVITPAQGPEGRRNISCMQIQADDKIVVCGHNLDNTYGHRVAIARYNTDGNLDQGFGTNGEIILNEGLIPSDQSYLRITDDGKIIVVTTTRLNIDAPDSFLVAKYNSNGSPDVTFGNEGTLRIGQTGYCYGFEMQNDGKMIIIGTFATSGQVDFGIVRLTPSGNLDPTFGINGRVRVNMGSEADQNFQSIDFPTYCKILDDGEMIIGGAANSTGDFTGFKFALLKLKKDGAIQTDFGNNGKVITSFGEHAEVATIMTNVAGEIYALGVIYTLSGGGKPGIAKYDFYGNLVSDFGVDGTTTTEINTIGKYGFLQDGFLTSEEKIIATGANELPGFFEANTILAQYNSDGSLDTNFGTNGISTFDLNNNMMPEGMTTILQCPDGKIITGGYTNDGFVVARFVDETLATADFSQSNMFSVFPNPATDVLNIRNRTNESINKVTIVDVLGKKVFESGDSNQIDVSKLMQGVYFIQIASQGKITTQKFIKK